jgi:soluble lytic murein transglycosylase
MYSAEVPGQLQELLTAAKRHVLPAVVGLALLATSCGGSLPIPSLFAPPTSTPLATATPTPEALSTPTALPTLTPTPIVSAVDALGAALTHQRNGDYYVALNVYQAIASGFPGSPEAGHALYGLSEVYLLDQNYAAAVDSLLQFQRLYPDDERYPFATFMLATAYDELGLWDEAIVAYREYGEQRTIIADYVHLNVGYALLALERYEEARDEFAQVLDLSPPVTLALQALQNMALASRRLEQYEAAIGYYHQLLNKAQNDGTRAETLYQMGLTYLEWEDPEHAAEVFNQLTEGYARTYRAYQALEELDALDAAAVSPFQRGLIYYHNGLYDPAVLAFYDHIENVEDTAEAHYYAALAYRGYDAHYLSVEELETIIEDFPSSDLVGQAWLEISRSWILVGNNEFAMDTYRQFFLSLPQDPLADDAQWKLANMLEDEGEWDEATAEYADLAERFPEGESAAPALFRAGLGHYRLGRQDQAVSTWQEVLDEYPASDTASRALFWQGKTCLEHGDSEDGLRYLDQLLSKDPTGYYGLRASDLLRGAPPENPPDIYSHDLYHMDDEDKQLALEEWLTGWAGDGQGQPLRELAPRVKNDRLFQRGLELLRVGQRESAKARLREVRTRFQDDPLALYQLAFFLQAEGFNDQSIACAQRILKLSPQESLYDVPRLLQKLHYPVYFADLIVPQAEKRGLEPLLFFALIWQESWYDPLATSSYPARGLTQFIEPTADWAAEELGITDFQYDDLYRPVVSVEFGGWYLEWILDYEEGEVFRALAHYNAGPVNVARWRRDGEVTDIDLFVEEIDLGQTESFIHLIYGHYWTYRTAYCDH